MKVPNSALDSCHDSFKAADEKRVKASTKVFQDTGLMALICRHDRVLWLVNMTEAGERQYYAFALLDELFHHLPTDMTVGVLYDIGCQLHRSCEKWDFLPEFRERILWGISVLHAYGHQWPCQLIYHPRKCKGFGLSDGEGCERFWSSIKLLIPTLRVSGYYKRLYSLDTQVHFLLERSLLNMGKWLTRKWNACEERKQDALQTLNSLNLDLDLLQIEWENQVTAQTKPLARQSKSLASKAIKEILNLMALRKSCAEERENLDSLLLSGDYDDADEILTGRKALQEKLDLMAKTIAQKREALGVDGRANLKGLVNNKFLQVQMNAKALKQRICTRIRDRKFQLERLERAYRSTTSSERKLHDHVSSQVKRHEPGILQLVNKYNALCEDLSLRLSRGEGTSGAVAPVPIKKEGLFKLDVDDEIWQNIGLNENEAFDQQVPDWLGDENTRIGIRAMLYLERCTEETGRLAREISALQDWMMEEWCTINLAIDKAEGQSGLVHQLEQDRQHLVHLCAMWETSLETIPDAWDTSLPWGPSQSEIHEARLAEATAQVAYQDEDEDFEDVEDEEEELLGNEEDLWDALNYSHYTDAHEAHGAASSLGLSDMVDFSVLRTYMEESGSRSPHKRARPLGEVEPSRPVYISRRGEASRSRSPTKAAWVSRGSPTKHYHHIEGEE
ncbi:hypothetical protein FPV67DRAFT_1615717 [Lyophyllum atratum]|nr:hypothetical protein FPV67DRAFT_1615717 [Lyophyllum atratum]